MALLLRRRGIEKVRPLAGGFVAWQERGFPTQLGHSQPKTPAVASE